MTDLDRCREALGAAFSVLQNRANRNTPEWEKLAALAEAELRDVLGIALREDDR